MAMGKKPGLSIAVLLGKGKPKSDDGEMSDEMSSDMGDSEESEGPSPGLVEAMAEFRAAMAEEDDEGMAKAFQNAMECC